ncbi:HupE/UreJ family protein [Marinobacter sp. M216]|uniref:HupE/UreJ family protein n=1 Tax=Marinobacter albus TaxID=3030833 RepID=A0ABT7HET8_9GAMM|nr:HupE/UreJ family protein [Marinobacter sp. M216]MDK9558514.1 HupE/UreJ family protein [Marinobacter sp. M216]
MSRSAPCMRLIAAVLLMFPLATPALAHKASDSFLYVDTGQSELRIDVALRDLALLMPLDRNGDQQLSGREVRAQRAVITRTLEEAVTVVSASGSCSLTGTDWGISTHSDGHYSAARYRLGCPNGEAPQTLSYTLLFDRDSLHRGLVRIDSADRHTLAVLSPAERTVNLLPGTAPGAWGIFTTFLYEGVIHLLIGLDHILFLLVLVLPASLMSASPGSTGPPGLRPRLIQLAGIVTAFTLAHSVTLALAALGIVRLPVAWVETVIALSIALAALNVVWPVFGRKTWRLAFAFGLVHGFGFASVLGDLTGGEANLAVALAGFNLGVEVGQLGLLVLGFPVLYLLARFRLYQRALVPAVLAGVGGISLLWVIERAASI